MLPVHRLHLAMVTSTRFIALISPKMKVRVPNTSTGKPLQPSANLRPTGEGAPG